VLSLLVLSCAGTDPATDDTTTSSPSPSPIPADAACTATEHPLRFSCTATLPAPAAATLTVSGPGFEHVFTDPTVATEHTILAWGLPPETDVAFELAGKTGTFRTGALIDDLANAVIEVTGEAFGFDAILQPLACEQTWFVLIDPEGRIVWYEPSPGFASWHDGYSWSAADRSVLSTGPDEMVEIDVSGEQRLQLLAGFDFEGTLHHDVARWNGFTYLLFEELFLGKLVDGFLVFDGDMEVGRFFLGDHYSVEPQGRLDWSHANGIRPNEAGQIAMSLMALDTVVLVDGDPASPSFLQPLWTAVGSTEGLPYPDYVAPPEQDEGFVGQHEASYDGTSLWLFDNLSEPWSRGLRLALDDAAGTVTVDRSWPLTVSCPVQGGTTPVDGGVLVTCARGATITLFPEDSGEAVWTLAPGCTATTDVTTHAVPVWID